MTKFHSDDYIKFLRSIRPDNMSEYSKLLQRWVINNLCILFKDLKSVEISVAEPPFCGRLRLRLWPKWVGSRQIVLLQAAPTPAPDTKNKKRHLTFFILSFEKINKDTNVFGYRYLPVKFIFINSAKFMLKLPEITRVRLFVLIASKIQPEPRLSAPTDQKIAGSALALS